MRNRLREFGLRARRPYIGFHLTRARRAHRMAWLAAHVPNEAMETGPFLRPDGRRRICRMSKKKLLMCDVKIFLTFTSPNMVLL